MTPEEWRSDYRVVTAADDPLDPADPDSLDKHGNPNVLTLDKGTSSLAQGPIAHSALVEVAPWSGPLPPVTAFDPPAFAD